MFVLGLLLLACVASAQTYIAYGAAATVQPGASTYCYSLLGTSLGGPFINVTYQSSETAAVTVTVTFHLYTAGLFDSDFSFLNGGLFNIGTNMVQSYAGLSINLQAGFTIATTPTNANVALTISFPSVDSGLSVGFLSQANVNAGILKVDSTNKGYIRVPTMYSPSPYMFSASLWSPIAGDYALVAVNEQVTVSATIETSSVVAPANSNQTFGFTIVGEVQADLQITFNSSTQNNITVMPYSSPPSHTAPSDKGAWLAAYWSISLSSASATHSSKVVYKYSDSQVSAAAAMANTSVVDATKLSLYMAADGSASAWTKVSSNVDVSAHTCTAVTTHFSDWSVYYSHNAGTSVKAQLGVLIALLFLALSL